MKWSILGTKSFHFQYDSFQIGIETNLFGNEIFLFPNQIISFQKKQLVAFSKMEHFRIFFFYQWIAYICKTKSCILKNISFKKNSYFVNFWINNGCLWKKKGGGNAHLKNIRDECLYFDNLSWILHIFYRESSYINN